VARFEGAKGEEADPDIGKQLQTEVKMQELASL
jgi:hypothetical protein